MTPIYEADDGKYMTFKRAEFVEWLTKTQVGAEAFLMIDEANSISLKDAVVIRRQDLYASPALASYAAAIVIAIKTTDDPKTKANLQAIADYFQRQSELAADEGWKLPDL